MEGGAMSAAQRERRWLAMIDNPISNNTSEVDFDFVMDLVACQPRVTECVFTSSLFGGRGFHAPCDVQLHKGSVLGVYGGGLPNPYFNFEHADSDELLYGKPRSQDSPAIVCTNTAYGCTHKRFSDSEMEAAWYYVCSPSHSTAQMKAKLDGFALELKDGRFVAMLYVSRRTCTVEKGAELLVQSYGRTFWGKYFNKSALFELQNMRKGSSFVSSEFVNIDGDQFVGLFWGEIRGSTEKEIYYTYDQSTTSLQDDSVYLGNAPVVNSKGTVIKRADMHHRVLFSKAIQHYFMGEDFYGSAYVNTSFTNVLDVTGEVIGDFNRDRMGKCVEAVSAVTSMLSIVLNNVDLAVDGPLPAAAAAEVPFTELFSVDALVAEDAAAASPLSVSVSELATPQTRKRLGYSSTFVAFEGASTETVGTQTEVTPRKRMRCTSPVVLFETQPVQKESTGTQTSMPWARPRSLLDFIGVLEQHRDLSDTRAIVLKCRDVLTMCMNKDTPAADLHRVYELVMQHKHRLFVKPCTTLAAADTVSMLFYVAVRINVSYIELKTMVGALPWIVVHPEAFNALSVRADTSSEAVILYAQCTSIMLCRGLSHCVLRGLKLFRDHLAARVPQPVIPCGQEAMARADKLLRSAALFSPEMHEAVLAWRLLLAA